MLRINSLTPITRNCAICHKPFVENKTKIFNPIMHIKGICTNCNAAIAARLLKKGHQVISYDR